MPDAWEKLLERACAQEGFEKISEYVRHLIRKDLKAKGLIGNAIE